MTTGSEGPNGSAALAALAALGRDGARPPTRAELDQGLNALYSRIAADRVRRRAVARWSLVGAAAVAAALLVLQIAAFSGRRAAIPERLTLAYEIEGGRVLEGGYLRESGHAGIRLRFNEGSRFQLMPGTRGRLREVDRGGARVAIEDGTASFEVTPSSDRKWLVEVGPFLVTVKGTAFTVSWDPPSERFELVLRRGEVEVNGPVSGGSLALRAGQRLVISLARGETLITEEQRAESVVDPSGVPASSAAPSAAPGPSATVASSASARGAGARRWTEALARGQWDRILEDVEHAGLEATLDGATSEELFVLADAARYRRRADLARAALLAARRRFPGSPRALDAAFLLGRVEESGGAGAARAVVWYDEYITRAPAGPYAAEALGRKMTLINELSGPAAARPLAEEYLRRFPKGSYAGPARALLRGP